MKWVNGTDTIVVSIGALRILVPYVQFKKRKKHPCRSVNFSKVAGLKLTLLHGCFLRFLNYTNGTKLRNIPHIVKIMADVKIPIFTPSVLNLSRILHNAVYVCISLKNLFHPNMELH